jgi:hypothetical protein
VGVRPARGRPGEDHGLAVVARSNELRLVGERQREVG